MHLSGIQQKILISMLQQEVVKDSVVQPGFSAVNQQFNPRPVIGTALKRMLKEKWKEN